MIVNRTTVVLVTGAAGGIGAASVERFRADGATVIASDIVGDVDLTLDVTDLPALRTSLRQVVDKHGYIDVAVSCSGIGTAGLADTLDDGEWSRSIDVNLTGTINTIRAAYEVMLPRRRGHLVALASLAGLVPTPLLVPYATTKGGLISFMTSLRPEAARNGIGATVVCPGPVDAGLLDGATHSDSAGQVDLRRYLTKVAGPCIAPAEVADAIATAVRRNRSVVTPRRAHLVHLAARLTPRTTERIVTYNMKRELRHWS